MVNTSIKVLGEVSAAVLALKVPDENMTSITTRELSMTLGRHTPERLAGLEIKGGNGRLIFPPNRTELVPKNNGTRFVDIQVRAHCAIFWISLARSLLPILLTPS